MEKISYLCDRPFQGQAGRLTGPAAADGLKAAVLLQHQIERVDHLRGFRSRRLTRRVQQRAAAFHDTGIDQFLHGFERIRRDLCRVLEAVQVCRRAAQGELACDVHRPAHKYHHVLTRDEIARIELVVAHAVRDAERFDDAERIIVVIARLHVAEVGCNIRFQVQHADEHFHKVSSVICLPGSKVKADVPLMMPLSANTEMASFAQS